MHFCDGIRECDGVWPIPAPHVFNTKLTENTTRRVTDESQASFRARTAKRQHATGAMQSGKEWSRLSGYMKRYKGNVLRTAHYSGGKFKLENECGDR